MKTLTRKMIMKTFAHKNLQLALALVTLALNLSMLQPARAAAFLPASPLTAARYYHTTTLLPNGKVLVAGGWGISGITNRAELYDPATGTWTTTGSMTHARYLHTATLLPNGKVLVTGGEDSSGFLSSAELYDPLTGTWATTGALNAARELHTATLLPNGKVLATGGWSQSGITNSSELYDPTAGTWTATSAMTQPRYLHTATLLPNGKVLVAGGYRDGVVLASAELYDPANGTWTATGALAQARQLHTATLLPDGNVLVAGGYGNSGSLSSAELYNPLTDTWTTTGDLTTARHYHTATLLPNGKVLVTAGLNHVTTFNILASAELYDPTAGTWTATNSLNTARELHTATLLPSGRLLITGGYNGNYLSSAELYDWTSGAWTATGVLSAARYGHAVTLLPNGKVLVVGGYKFDGGVYLSSVEVFDPATGTWTATGALTAGRMNHRANLLPDGKVLVTGGWGSTGVTNRTELYDPATGTWATMGALNNSRENHTATLLPSGKVLVAGGNSTRYPYVALASAEIYDPTTGTWTMTGSLSAARLVHTAALLPTGKVLVAGGTPNDVQVLSSAELYDPASGVWTVTGALNAARSVYTATLLPNGKVLAVGGLGSGGVLSSTEMYDPATGTWMVSAPLNNARRWHTATLLASGKVLIAGGNNMTGEIPPIAELYDPATGTWTASGAMTCPRVYQQTALLANGKVLVVAGVGARGSTNSTELYDFGLCSNASWQPQIATATSPLNLGGSLVLTGSRFRGVAEGSSGNTQDSPADYPVVQLRSIESGQTLFLLSTNWSTNSFTSAPVSGFPSSWALATVFVNGIPSTGSIFNISVPMAPVITAQPASRTNLVGTTATFTVAATGSEPLSYQWVKNGTNFLADGGGVSGARAPTLTLTNVQSSDAGLYSVVVSNAGGSTNSANASLMVLTPCISVSADHSEYAMGAAFALHVRSFDCASSNSIPNLPVVVSISTAGTTRTIPVTTGASGEATVYFQPLAGEAGQYEISAGLPGQPMPPAQTHFAIVGIGFSTNEVAHRLVSGVWVTNHVELRNLTGVPLSGIAVNLVDAPTNVTFQYTTPATLPGYGTNTLTYVLKSTAGGADPTCWLRVTSAEGATNYLPVVLEFVPPFPQLVASPASLQRTMVRGDQTLVEVQLANAGGAPAHDIQVLIPSAPWFSLVSAQRIASLGVGETNTVILALTPAPDLPLNSYPSYILFRAVETDLTLPIEFRCVSTLQGDLLVVVTDEFTYLAAGAPRVTNAMVTVSERPPGTNVVSGVTDATGAILFTNLTEDYYDVQVRADKHGDFSTTYLVQAGQANKITAFLSRETVSYEWIVITNSETDEYEVYLETVFDVAVPWPSLTVTPADLNLCGFAEGTNWVNFAITNHSLIRAAGLKLTFPPHPAWEILPLTEELGDLAPQTGTIVPVRIRRIGSNGNVPSRMDGSLHYSFVGNGIVFARSVPIVVWNANAWDCVPPPRITLEPKTLDLCSFPDETNVNFTIRNLGPMDVEGMTLAFDSHVHWQIEPLVTNIGSLPAQESRVVSVLFRKVASPTSGPSRMEGRLSYQATLEGETRSFSRSTKLYGPNPWDCVPLPLVTIQPGNINLCGFTSETASVEFTIHNRGPIQAEDLRLTFPSHPHWQFEPSVTDLGALAPQASRVISVLFRRLVSATDGPSPIAGQLDYRATVQGETRSFSPAVPLYNPNPWDCVPWPPVTIEPSCIDLCSLRSVTNPVIFTLHNRSSVPAVGAKVVFDNTHPHWRFEPAEIDLGTLPAQSTRQILVNFIQIPTTTNGSSWIYERFEYQATVEIQTRHPSLPIIMYGANDSDCVLIPPWLDGGGGGGGGGGSDGYNHEQGTLGLQQKVTVNRNTFTATLKMTNHSTTFPLTNVSVTLDILDAAQQPAADRFGVRPDVLTGLTAVDGTGTLGVNSSGIVSWTLIPANNAAPTGPTQYTVGGEVAFMQDGEQVTIPLYPVPITVLPDPHLCLDYFWERTAYSDDPITGGIIEPPVPFAVGMIMRNEGLGTARSIQVVSAKPKIVDNASGLLIGFNLVGAQVGNQPMEPDLTLDLGDLAPSNTVEAIWWMTTSLLADFIDYKATFTHVNGLGQTNLSLIDSVSIHPLLHVVRADVPSDDTISDFLVSEGYPTNVLPGSLYLSGGSVEPVAAVTTGATQGTPGPSVTNVQLTADVPAGWVYLRVPDPAPSTVVLSSVQRSDGRSLMVGPNVWSTHRNVYPAGGNPYREDFLHLLDYITDVGPVTYTLGYTIAPEAPAIAAQPASVTNVVGSNVVFSVVAIGTEPLTYQWFHNGSVDYRSAGADLHIFGLTTNDAGSYYVRVSNAGGITSSTPALLVVLTPPVICTVSNQVAIVGRPLVVTNCAYDQEPPITFSLGTNNPVGATITANGIFRWTPACGQGSSNYLVTVWATDSGIPPTSNSMTFFVMVPECIEASLSNTVVQAGHTGSVPVLLLSTTALTNMAFTVGYPPERFTSNFTLIVNSPNVLTQQWRLVDTDRVELSFTLSSNSILYGPTNVGDLGFTAVSNQSSAFVSLPITDVRGLKPDSKLLAKAYGGPGRVVVVGPEPLLEAGLGTNQSVLLTLYGLPGMIYTFEWKTNLLEANWVSGWSLEMTNLSQTFEVPATNPAQFFRAWRP
jgi:N-acetylneuraminic acid mutarotase